MEGMLRILLDMADTIRLPLNPMQLIPYNLPDTVPVDVQDAYEAALTRLLSEHTIEDITELVQACRRERLEIIKTHGVKLSPLTTSRRKGPYSPWFGNLDLFEVTLVRNLVKCLDKVAQIEHYGLEDFLGNETLSALERIRQQRRSRLRPRMNALDRAIMVSVVRVSKAGSKPSAKLVEKELAKMTGNGIIERITDGYIYWIQPRKHKNAVVKKLALTSLPSKITRLRRKK